ncbi:hypothetical protein LCAUW4_0354 [Lacticaseibacillus casei UW4]|nr:hypothetical protein LCAUW4_0354 [Lacticaseibacillus casei UW4]
MQNLHIKLVACRHADKSAGALSTAGFCLALIPHSTSNKAAKEQVPKRL